MRDKVHHAPLAKADRGYRRTCSQAEDPLGPQQKFGPAREARGLILVGVDPTARFSTGGTQDLPSPLWDFIILV
jgi:hypothetical protein